MRILVTGAKGQVGSELVLEGRQRGLHILATGREELDISREDAVNEYFCKQKPDVVINAAAYTAVDKAESEPELAYAINRDGAINLARACAKNRIPLLHISTDYVFDGTKEGPYAETDTPNPQCIYGKSKLEGERAIEAVLEEYIILRVSWVFGANGNNFVKTMLRLGREKDVLKVVSDQYGGPTWAGAIAVTLLDMVKRLGNGNGISWGIYHYSGAPSTSWHGFAEVVFEEAEKMEVVKSRPRIEAISTSEYPTPARRPQNSILDCKQIERLNICRPDWSAGLRRVIEASVSDSKRV